MSMPPTAVDPPPYAAGKMSYHNHWFELTRLKHASRWIPNAELMLNRLEQLTVDSHQMDCFALGPSISLVREQDVFHIIESMGNDYAEFAYLQRPACEGKVLLDKLQDELKLASISEQVDQHARALISTWCRQDQLYHKEFLRDVLRAWNIDTKLIVDPGVRDDFSTVSRQLERRLELLRRHLPELERKMASAIIELTHARSRWKEQLAHIQHTKVTCEQMESENEQHARRIQELLAKKRRLEVQMRYKDAGGSKFQRDPNALTGSMTFSSLPAADLMKMTQDYRSAIIFPLTMVLMAITLLAHVVLPTLSRDHLPIKEKPTPNATIPDVIRNETSN